LGNIEYCKDTISTLPCDKLEVTLLKNRDEADGTYICVGYISKHKAVLKKEVVNVGFVATSKISAYAGLLERMHFSGFSLKF
jgi:hypothetical protein